MKPLTAVRINRFKQGLFGAAFLLLCPSNAFAIQLHSSSEGIITHQIGHIFFLFSMVVLVLTIRNKKLDAQKGWRYIQFAAFLFVLWNLSTIIAHFLDNQVRAVSIKSLSLQRMQWVLPSESNVLAWVYYFLKMDHLLCVPAMYLLYRGLSHMVTEHQGAKNGVS